MMIQTVCVSMFIPLAMVFTAEPNTTACAQPILGRRRVIALMLEATDILPLPFFKRHKTKVRLDIFAGRAQKLKITEKGHSIIDIAPLLGRDRLRLTR